MRPLPLAAAALALALSGCAGAPPGTPIAASPIPPTAAPGDRDRIAGELSMTVKGRSDSAQYGPYRVAGPSVNLSYDGEGAWVGSIGGASGRLVVSPGRLQGAAVKLNLLHEGDAITLRGLFGSQQVSLRLTGDTISGRLSSNAPGFELKKTGPGQWEGQWGPGAHVYLQMRGDAAQFPDVLAPQFYLALLAVLR
jgi:hypothetical protein